MTCGADRAMEAGVSRSGRGYAVAKIRSRREVEKKKKRKNN